MSSFNNLSKDTTIKHFGEQWKIHGTLRPDDFWTSDEMFKDYLSGCFDPELLKNKVVIEVGAGSGRILTMIERYLPSKIIAVEPSQSFFVLKKNTERFQNIEYINKKGEEFECEQADYIFSLGVIHHIPNPIPTLENIHRHLTKNGKFIIWVYGKEGNKLYISLFRYIFFFTRYMPDKGLDRLSNFLQYLISFYGKISTKLPFDLPLKKYLENVFLPCGNLERKYIIFDQLNPSYAKYYKADELHSLLRNCGFEIVDFRRRHGYSHIAVCEKRELFPQ